MKYKVVWAGKTWAGWQEQGKDQALHIWWSSLHWRPIAYVCQRDREIPFSEKQTHWICHHISHQERSTKSISNWKESTFVMAECLTLSPRLSALRKNTLHEMLTWCKIHVISQPEALWLLGFLTPSFLFLYLLFQKQAALKDNKQICNPPHDRAWPRADSQGRDF